MAWVGRPAAATRLWGWLCLLALSLCSHHVDALIGSDRLVLTSGDSRGAVAELAEFGYKAGGLLGVSVVMGDMQELEDVRDFDGAGVYLAACKRSDITDALQMLLDSRFPCHALEAPADCFLQPLSSETEAFSSMVSETTVVHIALVTCNYRKVVFEEVDFIMTNPGGEQLGTRYEPVKLVYTAMLILWMVLFTSLFIHTITNLKRVTPLHKWVITLPVAHLALVTICYARWALLSSQGTVPNWLQQFFLLAPAYTQTLVFLVTLMAARGWCVTRAELLVMDKRGMASTVMTVLLLLTFEQYATPVAFLVRLTAYMIELTAVVCGIAANFRLLSLQLRLMQADRADAAASAAAAKARMYRSLQLLFFAYVCSKIMLEMLSSILDERDPWSRIMAAEAIEYGFCFALSFLLRFQRPNIFNAHEPPSLERGEHPLAAGLYGLQRNGPGSRAPPQVHNIPLYSDGSIPPGFVIIENPPELDADGKLVRNVAVASVSLPDGAAADAGSSSVNADGVNAEVSVNAGSSANLDEPGSAVASQALLSSFQARSSDEIAALTAAAPTEGASTPNPLLNPPPSSFRASPLPSSAGATTTAERSPEPRSRPRQGFPGKLSSFVSRLTRGAGRAPGRSPRGVADSEGQPQSPTLVSALLERTTSDASETGGQIELPLSPPGGSANGYFASGRPAEEGPTGRDETDGQESVAGRSDGQRSAELVDRLTRLRAAIAAHRGEEETGTSQGGTGREVPGKESTEGRGWGTITGLPDRVDSSNGSGGQETGCGEKKSFSPEDVV
ncbi:hypothetical protein KFL_003830100 [Klebsormidium nitens]|uniref:Lung seven transmembrane receptor family protein n=1 Tax=Klebsormidium nitens TaxID=105231 RepID=A0A1Y1IFJ4_KLENI|nr:hypothetical protein KFL_003830100 [Klebsormidium nitens]|eukprot:GAQ87861.1 hypothetical protein KFL_003830100 [Klebsormidium nitens]